jgi:hypothetical protein
MAEALKCDRELIVDKSADEVWEWLSDVRNVMTANQFHVSVDCNGAEARSPRVGLQVPILHNILGRKVYRIARVSKSEDYVLSWGERIPDDAGYADTFPHSEGWKVESLGANRCVIRNHVRGQFMLPVGQLIGKYVWDKIMPVILDNDLQDVAFAVGAIAHKSTIEAPPGAAALLRLANSREIDGKPAGEVLDMSLSLSKQQN